MMMRPLSPLEARVLSVLVEKQHTVPDTYPLSLNALTLGCNQKSNRDPVMEASEAQIQVAIDALKTLDLVFENSGGRVTRYSQNFTRVYGVPTQAVALLTVLMLRGPQTLAELRIHSERIHKFSDVFAVEGFMQELANATPPRAIELPRAAGARELRWMHLLCGEIDATQFAPQVADQTTAERRSIVDISATELAALKLRIEALEDKNAVLSKMVNKLGTELGLDLTELATPPTA